MFENLRIHPALAFIFDMDGVIVESTELHTRAWDEYLSRQGIAANGIMSRMLGKRNDQIVHEVWGPDLPAGEVYRHGADKERLYRELVGTELDRHLVRGVREFVQAAHKAGVKCGLATNAEPLNVEFVVGGAGLKSCFGALVDGHQVKNAKPDPEVFLTAASRLGVRAENCIVFEDSPGGMTAARAAGARVAALLTTLKEAPQADLAIADFHDPRLLPWLSTLQPR